MRARRVSVLGHLDLGQFECESESLDRKLTASGGRFLAKSGHLRLSRLGTTHDSRRGRGWSESNNEGSYIVDDCFGLDYDNRNGGPTASGIPHGGCTAWKTSGRSSENARRRSKNTRLGRRGKGLDLDDVARGLGLQ